MSAQAFLAALAALFIVDAACTAFILKRGGVELNRLLARLMDRVGVQEALAMSKAAAFAVVAWGVAEISQAWRAAILAAYVLVVLWNLVQVYQLRRQR